MKSVLVLMSLILIGGTFTPLPVVASSIEESIEKYRKRQDESTPPQILNWLKKGNRKFSTGRGNHGGYPYNATERIKVSATGQRPLAFILSCIDSRTTPELVFDVSVGDLFTARVGANVTNDDIIGSMEIAVESGAKVVVILGHTDCGGVKAACNNLELGHMTQLLERVKPAIAETNKKLDRDPRLSKEVGERVATNRRYIAEVSHMNALKSTAEIMKKSSIISEKVLKGEIFLLTAVYNVDSGEVVFDNPLKR